MCDECTLWLHLTLDVMHPLGCSVHWLVKMSKIQPSHWLREVIILTYIDASFLPVNRCNKVQQERFRKGKIFYVIYRNKSLSNNLLQSNPIIAKWISEFKANLTLLGCHRAADIGSSIQLLHPLFDCKVLLKGPSPAPITCQWLVRLFAKRMWMWIIHKVKFKILRKIPN